MIINDPLFLTSHLPFGGVNVSILSLIASHSTPSSLAIELQAIIFLAKERFDEKVGISSALMVKVMEPSSS